MTAIKKFTPGFRLVDGGLLNQIVAAINNVTGAGTASPVAASTLSATGAVDLTGSVFALDNLETGITAHAGGGQGSAYGLTKAVSVVATVATAADSVALPAPTKVGQINIVINAAAANSLQVFGFGTDTINGVATATGVAQAAGKVGVFVAVSTGAAAAWWRVLSA